MIHAPLSDYAIEGREVRWYEPESLTGIPETIDVLVVDGPPNGDGAGNRWPAWSHFRDKMLPGSLVLVDDTARADERAMVNDWTSDGLKIIEDGGSFVLLEVS